MNWRRRIRVSLGLTMLALASVCTYRAAIVEPPTLALTPTPRVPELDRAELARHLSAAVAVPTVSIPSGGDPAAFAGLRDVLRQRFPRVHRELGLELVSEHAMLYHFRASSPIEPPIILAAHLDVVPVEPGTESEWTHPPFAGTIADGYVWGRGTLDDKAGAVGLLAAVESLLGAGFAPNRDIWLAFGHDEEVGGQHGAVELAARLDALGVHAEFLLDEGGAVVNGMLPGIPRPVALVATAEKGFASFELTADGEGGHASMPPRNGVVVRLARAVQRIDEDPMPAALRGPSRAMIDRLTPEFGLGPRLVLANLWLFEPVVRFMLTQQPASNAIVRSTAALTIFAAGTAANVLPARARAVVNMRLLPGDTVLAAEDHLRVVVDDPAVTIRCIEPCWNPSAASRMDAPGFRFIEQAIVKIWPDAVVTPSLAAGATDARHYANVADDAYRFLPISMIDRDRARLHGTDERLGIDDFAHVVRFYQTFITMVASR